MFGGRQCQEHLVAQSVPRMFDGRQVARMFGGCQWPRMFGDCQCQGCLVSAVSAKDVWWLSIARMFGGCQWQECLVAVSAKNVWRLYGGISVADSSKDISILWLSVARMFIGCQLQGCLVECWRLSVSTVLFSPFFFFYFAIALLVTALTFSIFPSCGLFQPNQHAVRHHHRVLFGRDLPCHVCRAKV